MTLAAATNVSDAFDQFQMEGQEHYADGEATDHIVLGAHGRTEDERPVSGGIAEIVAPRTTVPVTCIR